MGKFRLYADKTNCILEDYPLINTGSNEVAELWYGNNGTSRFLLRFDVTDYMNLFTAGLVPIISAATTTLKLKTVTPIFEDVDGEENTIRASNFDLSVYLQEQSWDEGIGKDFIGVDLVEGYSNWYSATSTSAWTTSGGSTNIFLGSQHFDTGGEDLEIDLLSVIPAMWSMFTGTNYGLMIAFSSSCESLSGAAKNIKKFYTRHTNTLYEPWLDITWNDQIRDDRNNMYSGSTGKICTFIKQGGNLTNPSAVTHCDILTGSSIISSYTATDILHPNDGIYYINFTIPIVGFSAGTVFSDRWTIAYNELLTGTVINSFTTVSLPWTASISAITTPLNYSFITPNLKTTYSQGERPVILIRARRNYQQTYEPLKEMYYRILLINGDLEDIEMIDWSPVSYTAAENFIQINTQWLPIDQTYQLDFKYVDNGSVIYDVPIRRFTVIS